MLRTGTCLTPAEVRRAEELKILGMGWKEVGKALKRHPETIRRVLDNEYREARCKQINAARRARSTRPRPGRYLASLGNHWADNATREPVPVDVIADRDRRLNAPRTLGMALLGDPLPGRSALDQRS